MEQDCYPVRYDITPMNGAYLLKHWNSRGWESEGGECWASAGLGRAKAIAEQHAAAHYGASLEWERAPEGRFHDCLRASLEIKDDDEEGE